MRMGICENIDIYDKNIKYFKNLKSTINNFIMHYIKITKEILE